MKNKHRKTMDEALAAFEEGKRAGYLRHSERSSYLRGYCHDVPREVLFKYIDELIRKDAAGA